MPSVPTTAQLYAVENSLLSRQDDRGALGCLDFFAGSGLATEGLKPYFHALWANDICPHKAKIYRQNHGEVRFCLMPIEEVHGRDLPSAVLSWGSFPCQDLSLAGQMNGLRAERSGLVWHWLRVMDEMQKRPPLVVAENVVGLVSVDEGNNYMLLHNALRDRGYKVGAVLIDAVHWVPQSRKRIFVIAVLRDIDTSAFEAYMPEWCHPPVIQRVSSRVKEWCWWSLPIPNANRVQLMSIIDMDAPCDPPEKRDYLLSLIPTKHLESLLVSKPPSVFTAYRRTRKGSQVLEVRFDGVAGCLRTPEGGSSRQIVIIRTEHGIHTRLLTARETALLMGLAPQYVLPGSYNDVYKAMGDAVVVPVVKYLSENLLYPCARMVVEDTNGYRTTAS